MADFRLLAILPIVLLGAAACLQDKPAGPPVFSRCLGISLPASTEVTLIGLSEGVGREDENLPADDRQPLRVGLSSGWRTKPQIVVLSGSGKIVWDFAGVSAEKIAGVITYGYLPQEIANLPASVPVKQVSYLGGKTTSAACGPYLTVYKGGPELDAAMAQIERATGFALTRFHGAYRATEMSLDGEGQWPAPPPESYLMAESGPYVGVDPREREDRGPGSAEVAALVADGTLRPATQADVDGWNARATLALSSGKLAAYASEYLQRPAAYVVLKPLPPHPAVHFRSFIYPADMRAPTGRDRQNNLYFMNTGTCRGSAPDCQSQASAHTSASSPWSS